MRPERTAAEIESEWLDDPRWEGVRRDYTAGEDIIDLGGYEIASVRESRAGVRLIMEGDGDTIWVRGVSTLDAILREAVSWRTGANRRRRIALRVCKRISS